MGFFGGRGDAALDLDPIDPLGQEGKRRRLDVAGLHLQPVPGDAAAVQARRRARLQPPHVQAEVIEPIRQADGRGLADAAGGDTIFAEVDQALEKGAGGQDDPAGAPGATIRGGDTNDAPVLHDQIFDSSGFDGQAGLRGEGGLHGQAIELAVDLRARASDRGALGTVKQAKLNAGLVRQATHEAVERVDLAYQMTLAQAADGGITGHLADGFDLVRQEQGARADPRRRSRGFASGVTAANDNDIPRGRRHETRFGFEAAFGRGRSVERLILGRPRGVEAPWA